jgi:hypothetical protein
MLLIAPRLQEWARGASAEEQQSFEYRNYLYSTFISGIEWFGRSPVYGSTKNQSTDSAILQLGLGFGWLVLITALLPLALSVVRLLSGRGSIAEIALVGQIPLFVSVALITQYESMIFFVAGLAVQMVLDQDRGEPDALRFSQPQAVSVRSKSHDENNLPSRNSLHTVGGSPITGGSSTAPGKE